LLDSKAYCFEFSPDEKIVYIGASNDLYQWNLHPGQFDSSLYLVASVPPTYEITGLRLASNGYIYVGTGSIHTLNSPIFEETVINKNLSIIESPDVPGVGCGFVPAALPLDTGIMTWGITDQVNYALGALEGSPCDTLSGGGTAVVGLSPEASVVLHPNPAKQEWRLSGLQERDYAYSVFDAMGREVQSGLWTAGAPHRISAINMPSGWYVVQVQHAGSVVWRGSALRR